MNSITLKTYEAKTAMADELVASLIRGTEEEDLQWEGSPSMDNEHMMYTLCQDTASGQIRYTVKREVSAETDREAFGFCITHNDRKMYTATETSLTGNEAQNDIGRLYHAAAHSFRSALAVDDQDIEILEEALAAIKQARKQKANLA